MSQFLRLLDEPDKARSLVEVCRRIRTGEKDHRFFQAEPHVFDALPGKPFAYWISDAVREAFLKLPAFEREGRTAKQGLATADDFRFVRAWWEVRFSAAKADWSPFAKGGAYSPFYSNIDLVVKWKNDGEELKNFTDIKTGKLNSRPQNTNYYFRPGLAYPPTALGYDRKGLGMYVLPEGCIFGHKACSVFVRDDDADQLLALLALLSSLPADKLFRALAQSRSWEVGHLQRIPIPEISAQQAALLSTLSAKACALHRKLHTATETSFAFTLPLTPSVRRDGDELGDTEAELAAVRGEIDHLALDAFGLSWADLASLDEGLSLQTSERPDEDADDSDAGEEGEHSTDVDVDEALLSWSLGVVFGRFDWRLATGDRSAPLEPGPFDPLPVRSPGMLPEGAERFHAHAGILVDDQGHPHDLPRLIEEVLARVEARVPDDVRRWLQRDFFSFHLQRYSKSRRKAPIYWPLATTSGSYTLWVYYPSLTSQTLYTAINDFVEPKLQQIGADVTTLRNKGANRTREDEKQFETMQASEVELVALRDTLRTLAAGYKPSHDDGVQIGAAPLWPLFRHKLWQKLLKDTWANLEKGNYDWAHLAMNYWPQRVREKCKKDKSLAIAHGLEHPLPQKTGGRKNKGGDE